ERKVLHRDAHFGRYASSGHLLYVQDAKLVAAPFDLPRLAETGRPVEVVDDVAHSLLNGTAQYALSDAGLLVYRRANNSNRALQWMDFAGQLEKIRDLPAGYQEVKFSPDGSRMLVGISDGRQTDVWA